MMLDEVLKNYVEEAFSGPDSSIYHYTKAGIGSEIIRSRHFRLTPHQDLNNKSDNGELIVGPELTKNYLKKTSLAKWEPRFNDFVDRGITLHIGSFCEEENYPHTIQKYGPDCLEFKSAYLDKLKKQSMLIGHVVYNIKKQKEIISTMLDLHEQSKEEDPVEKRISLFVWLFTVYPLLKEEKHHLDSECRIITAYCSDPDDPTKIIGKIQNQITFDHHEVRLIS
jgi:hypothetical protein